MSAGVILTAVIQGATSAFAISGLDQESLTAVVNGNPVEPGDLTLVISNNNRTVAAGLDLGFSKHKEEQALLEEIQTMEEFLASHGVTKMDILGAELLKTFPKMDAPVTHIFTPGLYTREIFMPAGSMIISKIHRTEHPYVISKGVVSVWTENDGTVRLTAPHTGVTKPGTQRVLYIHEDTIWTTFHSISDSEQGNVEMIEKRIISPHLNPLLTPSAEACEDTEHLLQTTAHDEPSDK